MIVMKFGRSSVASATAIEWVARIVKSRLEDQPALVVSAMRKTTDRRGDDATRAAWIRLFGVAGAMPLPLFRKSRAFCVPARPAGRGKRIAPKSRELHGLLIYLENGCILTPDLKDQILSFGEPLSSEIVAAAFERIRNEGFMKSSRLPYDFLIW